MKRRSAIAVIAHFEAWVRADEFRGASHPDIRDDIHNGYLRARERMIRHLMGTDNKED